MNEPESNRGSDATIEATVLPWFDETGLERVPRSRPVKRPGQWVRIHAVPRLFLEDIEAIHYLVSKHTDQIQMQTDEFRIRHPKQLKLLPQERIMQFTLLARDPFIRIEVSRYGHTVITDSDDPKVQELLDDIVAVFNRRQNRFLRLFQGFWYAVLVFTPMILSSFLILLLKLSASLEMLILVLGFSSVLTLPILGGIVGSNRDGVVIPMYKKDLPKAWYVSDALKVALLINLVTAIVTAIVTALIVGD